MTSTFIRLTAADQIKEKAKPDHRGHCTGCVVDGLDFFEVTKSAPQITVNLLQLGRLVTGASMVVIRVLFLSFRLHLHCTHTFTLKG